MKERYSNILWDGPDQNLWRSPTIYYRRSCPCSLQLEEVNLDGKIISAYVLLVNSLQKVLYQQESMLRCGNCQVSFLVKKATKTTAVSLNIKDDKDPKWYTFTSALETIIEHHNKTNSEQQLLTSINGKLWHCTTLCSITIIVMTLKLWKQWRNKKVWTKSLHVLFS